MKIVVYGFTTYAFFFRSLIDYSQKRQENHNIEWGVILPRGHFRSFFDNVVPSERICYLYENFDQVYRDVDKVEFGFPDDADNIQQILEKDKDGYRHLDKSRQLRLSKTIYKIYREFLLQTKPNYLLIPPLENVDGAILINLCFELGIEPLHVVGTRNLGMSFFSRNEYESLPPYFGEHTSEDSALAEEAIARFDRGELPAAFRWKQLKGGGTNYAVPSLVKRVVLGWRLRAGHEKLYIGEDHWRLRIKMNLLPMVNWWRRSWFKIAQSRNFDIISAEQKWPKKFIFLALQYTPESSINSLAPYWVDQLRVIDLLRLNMPQGFALLVKEHPAMAGVRETRFYRQLRRRAGLELVHPSVSSRALIERASLTVAVTGSIGLESFILGKPCLLFGQTFFSHLCYRLGQISNLKDELRRMIFDHRPLSRQEKIRELAKIYNVSHPFYIADTLTFPEVLSNDNIEEFYSAMMAHVKRLALVL